MTDDRRRDDESDELPGQLEHSSAWADEAREVTHQGDEAEIGDEELEEQAVAATADLDDDGDIDADDRALATTRGRKDAAGRPVGGSGGPRFVQFLRASAAELRRVQWPDRRQVGQATAVVIGFVIIAGAYLGFADWVAQRLVNFIL
ncbi:MAG: preprotein translocase subunit SecE [Baekduia sp.]